MVGGRVGRCVGGGGENEGQAWLTHIRPGLHKILRSKVYSNKKLVRTFRLGKVFWMKIIEASYEVQKHFLFKSFKTFRPSSCCHFPLYVLILCTMYLFYYYYIKLFLYKFACLTEAASAFAKIDQTRVQTADGRYTLDSRSTKIWRNQGGGAFTANIHLPRYIVEPGNHWQTEVLPTCLACLGSDNQVCSQMF